MINLSAVYMDWKINLQSSQQHIKNAHKHDTLSNDATSETKNTDCIIHSLRMHHRHSIVVCNITIKWQLGEE